MNSVIIMLVLVFLRKIFYAIQNSMHVSLIVLLIDNELIYLFRLKLLTMSKGKKFSEKRRGEPIDRK